MLGLMEHKFKVGNVVKLKSDGIELTVKDYLSVMENGSTQMVETNKVICKYFSSKENRFCEITEHEDMFELIK